MKKGLYTGCSYDKIVCKTRSLLPLTFLCLLGGCGVPTDERTLFNELSSNATGIDFSNELTENDSINYFNYMYIYMGGGVAVGDFNNDGLQDLYFTGNMVPNKLYLNKGDLKFEDVTELAGVAGDNRWMTGVTLGDANQDGWLDIYVSVSGKWGTTKNLLFVNDAMEGDIPTFTEMGEAYGLADEGNSTQAVFFDYDGDGLQDLYVINYPIVPSRTSMVEYLTYRYAAPYHRSDRLYKNEGNGNFIDKTREAGLDKYGLSLGVSVGDYNQDGWQDLYVSNDFSTPDFFYINNQDGTFTDFNLELTNHTSYFGMGTDAADFNNDGYLDIYQVDMMPKSYRRAKENMDSMDPERFYSMVKNDMHHQYSINTLQLHMGNDVNGLPRFGDIGKMAGVSSTDWSWASLFADFDNDGFKDIYVTNGVRRDINNSDYFRSDEVQNFDEGNSLDLTKKIPSEKIKNFAFQNKGDLTFTDVSENWGINFNGFSNGVAYADLDNDGDLDLVINNLDDQASIYENNANQLATANFLQIELKGDATNPLGLGAKIWLETDSVTQYQELTLTRGFQSSVDPTIHFGIGKAVLVNRIKVLWPNGLQSIVDDAPVNQKITINASDAIEVLDAEAALPPTFFKDITSNISLDHKHSENTFNDFQYQVLLPHKISEYGPALAVDDINNDGLDDFYIGGSSGDAGKMYTQNPNGTFTEILPELWKADRFQEDVGALFFDANGDGLPDLYVVCGGNELRAGDRYYQDKFYVNKGDGVFEKAESALPIMRESGSVVVASDIDQDGDLDLFVGGRVTPRNYPHAPKSRILRNNSSQNEVKFVDVTEEVAPDLLNLGMVTQAKWVDVDGDNLDDLMLVGEWMGITYLQNKGGEFINRSESSGLDDTIGWWFGLHAADFDQDGDMDFIVGNLGKNYKYQASEASPFSLYVYDYDNDSRDDLVLSYLNQGVRVPVRGRECSSQQIPAIKAKFKDYKSYASASLEQIYTSEDLEKSLHFEVKSFAHQYLENLGDGTFKIAPLDVFSQISSINSFVSLDINEDGYLDILYVGNLYGSEVETPRNDSSYGGLLIGDGNGGFKSQMPYQSGLMIRGEVKSAKKMKLADGNEGILFAKNNDFLQLIRIERKQNLNFTAISSINP
ncbi:VCBS repeat-containing protein [Cyclobacterium jeungdonense]|uniref:VCBS repeat-containing protein n=1 Tax=Cyclobacterium jeungdonense TaxID=708087 RepID=A0ABT8CBC8_9BACT|nr:VCBS repeat-containing protein [Cyclobacterium jeungdonense]MDN3689452.1 VCBS repeat-containing protein [Cyclobacterium jeungdonense]